MLPACPGSLFYMMSEKSDLVRRISTTVRPMIESMGFDLVRVKIAGGRKKTVQIMAERPDGSIDIDDCAEISRAVSTLLDVEDLMASEYMLEVSSPGLDRPLVRREDFKRFEGHLAKVKMDLPIDGRKNFVGRLVGLESDNIRLELENGKGGAETVCLPFASVADAQLVLTDDLIETVLKGAPPRQPH